MLSVARLLRREPSPRLTLTSGFSAAAGEDDADERQHESGSCGRSGGLDWSRGYLREWREQQERRQRDWAEAQRGRREHRRWQASEWDRMRARWAAAEGVRDARPNVDNESRNGRDSTRPDDAFNSAGREHAKESGAPFDVNDRSGASFGEHRDRGKHRPRGAAGERSGKTGAHCGGAKHHARGSGEGGGVKPGEGFKWWWEGGERYRWPEEEWARAKAGVHRQSGFGGDEGGGGNAHTHKSQVSATAADVVHYKTLGLPVGSPAADIHAAFRAAAMEVRRLALVSYDLSSLFDRLFTRVMCTHD